MQEDTIKWVYNTSESAREDNQKNEQKTAAQGNGDGFECKVEGGLHEHHQGATNISVGIDVSCVACLPVRFQR